MFEQLSQIVQMIGNEHVVNNAAIPDEHNQSVMDEASNSVISGLKNIVTQGGAEQIAGLFQGNNASSTSNPVVGLIANQFSGTIAKKFGINESTAASLATTLIPMVMSSLVNKAKDPNDNSINVSDIVGEATSGNSGQGSGILSMIEKATGLDSNGDGNADLGGIVGTLGKLFGK